MRIVEVPDVSGLIHVVQREVNLCLLAQRTIEMTHRQVQVVRGRP